MKERMAKQQEIKGDYFYKVYAIESLNLSLT